MSDFYGCSALEPERKPYICKNKLCNHKEWRTKWVNPVSFNLDVWEEKVVCPKCGGLNLYLGSWVDMLGDEERKRMDDAMRDITDKLLSELK